MQVILVNVVRCSMTLVINYVKNTASENPVLNLFCQLSPVVSLKTFRTDGCTIPSCNYKWIWLFTSQEYQSFTDLQFSKEKSILCIDWHPNIRGVVAVSVGERMAFDDRIDHAAKVIMTPSLILIWSFADPIHPQVGGTINRRTPHQVVICQDSPSLVDFIDALSVYFSCC